MWFDVHVYLHWPNNFCVFNSEMELQVVQKWKLGNTPKILIQPIGFKAPAEIESIIVMLYVGLFLDIIAKCLRLWAKWWK